jgi:hypothetical protein
MKNLQILRMMTWIEETFLEGVLLRYNIRQDTGRTEKILNCCYWRGHRYAEA